MIETEIIIGLNRISDLDIIKMMLGKQKIQAPIFILEYEASASIKFTIDYDYYELNDLLSSCFDDYEFVSEVENGKKEIRLQIYRYQSPLSSDGWGRKIENALNETLYLVKKNKSQITIPKFKVNVLFEDSEKNYFINIAKGIKKGTEERGFLVLEGFEQLLDKSEVHPYVSILHKDLNNAFWDGYGRLNCFVEEEFEKYIKEKMKQIRKQKMALKKIQENNKCLKQLLF